MPDFKAKMQQIQFPLELRPRPPWGEYSVPQTPWLYIRGLLLRGGIGEGIGEERVGEKKGGRG